MKQKGKDAINHLKERKKRPIFGRDLEDFRPSELTEGVPLPVYRGIEFLCMESTLTWSARPHRLLTHTPPPRQTA